MKALDKLTYTHKITTWSPSASNLLPNQRILGYPDILLVRLLATKIFFKLLAVWVNQDEECALHTDKGYPRQASSLACHLLQSDQTHYALRRIAPLLQENCSPSKGLTVSISKPNPISELECSGHWILLQHCRCHWLKSSTATVSGRFGHNRSSISNSKQQTNADSPAY